MIRTTTAFALLALLAGTAGAQAVYRCGNQYSQQPCPDGRQVQVEDPRTAAEAKRADAETQRQAKAADAMEKARLQQEASVAKAPVRPAPAPEAPTAGEPKGKAGHAKISKPKKPDYFTATSPRKPGDAPPKKKDKSA